MLIEAGHWKQARTLVEARIREAPDDPLSYCLLSQIRNAFGDRSTPLSLAEKAVSLDTRTAKYHRQVAEVLGVMAQHAGIVRQLFLARRFRKEIDTALGLDPRDVQALRDLLEFYLLAPGVVGGDAGKAAETAERIVAINRTEGFLAKARIAEFRKQTSETERLLRQAADSQPPSYRSRMALSQYYLAPEHPNLAAAEEQAREARKLDPSRIHAYMILAEAAADRAEWSGLEAILEASAKSVPDDFAPYYRAAERLLSKATDLPRAERYLRTYLSQPAEGNQPPHSEACWTLGLALEKQGRGKEAAAAWKESARLDPESPAVNELKRARKVSPL